MKQKISSFVVSLLIAGLMMVLPTMAEDMMAKQTHMAMEKSHAATMDQQIRKTNVKGYTLVYRLI
nr:hypothetical protein [Desulfobacteraceae bacterium]